MSASRIRRVGSTPVTPATPAKITLYPDAFTKTAGREVQFNSFPELAAFFSRPGLPSVVEDKRRAAFFTRGVVVVGSSLKKANVVGPFLVMLDIDVDQLPPAACSDRLTLFGVNHVLHTTFSQGLKAGHSYRVFVDLVASSWWELEGVTRQLFDLVGLEYRRESWQTLGFFVPSVHKTRRQLYRYREALDVGAWRLKVVPPKVTPETSDGAHPAAAVGEGIDDLDKLTAALAFVENEDRETWVSVGAALHSTGDERAFDVWAEWSASQDYDGFDFGDCERVWASYSEDQAHGGLTLGSVYHWATEGGFVMPSLSAEMREASNSAEDDFAGVEPPSVEEQKKTDPRLALLLELNESYAYVAQGQGVVADVGDGSDAIRYLQRAAFLGYFQRPKFTIGKGKSEQVVSIGQFWLNEWAARRSYKRTDFLPSGSPVRLDPEVLNSWRGWKYEDVAPGDFSLWQRLTREVICNGDDELYEWVVGWCADLVQRPYRKPGTALVLRSGEGTGKGTFARALVTMCGVHGIQVTQAKHLVGNFNQHLDSKILLFGDEVTWGGRKQEESVLKALVTEEIETRERKGIDAFSARSCLHVVLATNERWAVPAGPDARRFMVLDTAECGDEATSDERRDFCLDTHDQLEANGGRGYAGLLKWLRGLDLDEYPDPRRVVKTEALQEQKLRSLDPVAQTALAALTQGYWSVSPPDPNDLGSHGWPDRVATSIVYDFYLAIAKELGIPRRDSKRVFGARLREILGKVGQARMNDDARTRAYQFQDLETARAAFERFVGAPVVWGEDGGEEE